ncbi:hypothetical protein TNIN_13121, partial [Trichonephila inaurata madagascariensis]
IRPDGQKRVSGPTLSQLDARLCRRALLLPNAQKC